MLCSRAMKLTLLHPNVLGVTEIVRSCKPGRVMLSPRLTATYPHAVHYNHPKYTLYQNTPRLIQPTPGLNIRRISKWKLSGDYSLLLARLISFSGAGVVAQYGLWLLPQSQCRRTGAMGGSRLKRMYSLWQFGNIRSCVLSISSPFPS